jgi:hypothetical protein
MQRPEAFERLELCFLDPAWRVKVNGAMFTNNCGDVDKVSAYVA